MRPSPPLVRPSLFLCALLLFAAAPAEAQAQDATWTLLVYLAADNDLEAFAPGDLAEMAVGMSGDAANVLVLHDRAEGHDDADGDWTEARLLHWADGDWHTIEDWGEPNMGDPATLADFVAEGLAAFPAQQTALVIWDHGGGWQGVAYDESHANDGLTLNEVAQGLEQGLSRAGLERLDVLAFDACFMGTLEVAEAVAPYASLMVASQDLVPGEGYDYTPFLDALSSGRDPLAVVTTLVDGFVAYYEASGDAATLSVVDLERVGELLRTMQVLREAVATAPSQAAFDYAWATQSAPRFTLPDAKTRSSVDLFAVAELASSISHAPIAQAAREVLALQPRVMLHEAHSRGWEGVRGLSFHGVLDPQVLEATSDSYVEIPPESAALSQTLVDTANTLQAEDSDPPRLSPLESDASIISPGREASFYVSVRDANLARVLLVLMSEGEDGVFYLDQEMPVFPADATEDEAGNLVARWAPEEELDVGWDGYAYALETDTDLVLAPFREMQAGSPFYELWGSLERSDGRVLDSVLLRFDVRDGNMTSAWDLEHYQEIKLQEGDTFLLAWEGYDEEGSLVEGVSDPIPVGPSGFWMVDAPAPPGAYYLAVMAFDLMGNADFTDMLPIEVEPAEDMEGDEQGATDGSSAGDHSAPGAVADAPLETPWPHVLGPAALAATAAVKRRRRA